MPRKDWRTKPRKPAEKLRCRRLSIRVTEAELETIHERAEAAAETLADFILHRALGRRRSY